MAAHHKTIEHWSTAPDPAIRKTKTAMEDELLIKLGAKKEVIEFHPLILSSRLERAKSFVSMKYSRASPPAVEKSSKIRNPWASKDQALRQMTNPARRGPRDVILPNLVRPIAPVKVLDVPLSDVEYQARRTAAFERLNQLFGQWTVTRQSARGDLELRKISKGTVVKLAQGQPKRRQSVSSLASDSSQLRANHPVPRSRKRKNRWKDMAREVLLQLKSSHMRLPEELPRSELRLYVSSTPDLQEEREFLEEVAYPKLRELCEKLGLNCHVVDMRNGAGVLPNDVETFDLIEKELSSCRHLSIGPYFVSLIGHKLDDQNLPGFLHKAVYEEIRETLIKENIIGVEAFDDVYRLDSNRVPPVYIKQRIQSMDEYQSPEEIERILHTALSQAVSVIAKIKEHNDQPRDVDFYNWSAVVKELEEGLLTGYSPRSDTLCFMMDSAQAEQEVSEEDTPIRRLRHRIYNHYRHFASKESIVNFKTGRKTVTYLRALSDTFVSGVASLLKSQIRHREYDITQQLTEGSEALQHTKIALSLAEHNVGNEGIIDELQTILERPDPSPKTVLVWGPTGAGKTAVACQVAKASVLWQPRRKVVFRCLGSSLRSSSLFRIVESLIKQLDFIYTLDIELPIDMTLQQAVSIFCYALNAISEKRVLHGDLLLVLDQLEKLPDIDAHYLLCILNSLSEGTTLLLTLQTPHPLFNILKGHPTVHKLTRNGMSETEIAQYVNDNLKSVNRVVTADQLQSAVNALSTDTSPVYAQFLLHVLRWWPSHTLPDMPHLGGDPEEDFNIFLQSIESDLGEPFTQHALSLLATARFGLGDHELLHLLAKDHKLLDKIKEAEEFVSIVEGFPYQLYLSRLISRLGRFLMNAKVEGETVYQISSQTLARAIKNRYMNDSFFYTVHQKLANFFLFIRRGLLLSSRDISELKHKHLSKYHWRTLRCVSYHLCHSSADSESVWEILKEKVFFNFSWLVNEVYAGFLNDLLDDISYALEHVSLDPGILYLQQLLVATRQTIVHNPLSLAAIFASQNISDLYNVKDNIRVLVDEARVWLKQVHLQAMVPVSYTPDKINRLLVKENTLSNVTDLKAIPGTSRLLIQRARTLSILNMLTREEVPLATLNSDIIALHIEDEDSVIILTTSENQSSPMAEIFNLQRGKHLKTISLGNSPLLWFDIRSAGIYYAVDSSIKYASLDKGAVSTALTMKKPWTSSCLSTSKSEKIITALIGEKIKIETIFLNDVAESQSVSIKSEPSNKYCFPLLSTKDGKYIIYLTERQANVIETSSFKVIDTYSHNWLPIVKARLSRSHEHLFLAYANGAITCHVLYSGNEAMATKITPKRKPQLAVQKSRDKEKGRSTKGDINEIIKVIITSEDDHFLICGTTLGHVYVFHVPTSLQLVHITTEQKEIEKLTYLTDKCHFQHLTSMDVDGLCRHWNLRPLFKQARMILQLYITDDDLLKEEEAKLDLNGYFASYEGRKNNRIFLNGPDIAAFYQSPPDDIFAGLAELDPAFGVQDDWEITGCIVDLCDQLLTLVCGNELGDVALTVSTDFRLARWSLQDGSLVWTKRLHIPGETIIDMVSVYYDQAVMLVQQSRLGHGLGVSVVYTGEGQNKVMSRDNVIGYWASVDKTRVMLLCQGMEPGADTKLLSWDLINTKEETCELMSVPLSRNIQIFMTFSPTLLQNVSLTIPSDYESGLAASQPISSAYRRIKSYRSAPDPDVGDSDIDSASPFDLCEPNEEESVRPSVPQGIMRDSKSFSANTLLSKAETPLTPPEITSPNPGEMENSNPEQLENSDTEPSNQMPLEETLLTNYATRIHWTKVNILTQGPEAAKHQSDKMRKLGTSSSPNPHGSGSQNPSPRFLATTINTKSNQRDSSKQSEEKLTKKEQKDIPKSLDDYQNQDSMNCSEFLLKLQITAICFVGENALLIGTSSHHVLLMTLPSFDSIWVLNECGPTLTQAAEMSVKFLRGVTSPHTNAVTFVTVSDDMKMLISSDGHIICVWEMETKTLKMKIVLDPNQEITFMDMSKDAAIIVIVTNKRTIQLWTPIECREVASYMTTFDILDLQMTCDCRKVIVRGVERENKPILEIFDVRNVDDILVHLVSRKESQKHEREINLINERIRKSSRQHSENRRKSHTLVPDIPT